MVADRRGVKVVHGANDGEFEVAGETVGVVRASLVNAFNLTGEAVAFANGRRVPNDYELQQGDVLEFIHARGVKGGGKKALTEADLNNLGFAVVGDEVVPAEDGCPDESWETGQLEAFAKRRLTSSGQAERQAILQAEKAAVDLFWAGCALQIIRAKKKAERHGAWTEWKRTQGYHDTTVNDAIRLFEKAKTPDALYGMGITAAKEKFVYPFQHNVEDEEASPSGDQRTGRPAKARGKRTRTTTREPTTDPERGSGEEGQGTTDEDDESPATDPASTLTTELEEIAQRLNEIAQDDLGKVDLKNQVPDRLLKSIQAVSQGIDNIYRRISRELPNS